MQGREGGDEGEGVSTYSLGQERQLLLYSKPLLSQLVCDSGCDRFFILLLNDGCVGLGIGMLVLCGCVELLYVEVLVCVCVFVFVCVGGWVCESVWEWVRVGE